MVLGAMSLDTWIAFSSLILSLLGVTISLLVRVTKRITKIEYTLFPNSGDSLRDKVDKTERKLDMLISRYETDREYRD
jgi:hypothetical protein